MGWHAFLCRSLLLSTIIFNDKIISCFDVHKIFSCFDVNNMF